MVSRLQRPVWLQGAARDAACPRTRSQAICDRIADALRALAGEHPSPGCSATSSPAASPTASTCGGTNCVTDAACASSLAALSMARQRAAARASRDLVITGGVDTMNDIFMYMCFSKTPALSPTGDCRPFSDGADGTMLGEGIGDGRAEAPRRRRARRRPHLRGDPRRRLVVRRASARASTRRVPEGQARALRRAYEAAGYGPETVELVEAHGTGTKAGDAAEFEGLQPGVRRESGRSDRAVVRARLGQVADRPHQGRGRRGRAVQGGHGAAPQGAAADDQGRRARTRSSRSRRSPFYLNTAGAAVGPRRRRTRGAPSVSSFGFGGSNFHVALEEYAAAGAARPPSACAPRRRSWCCSAPTDAAGLVDAVPPDGGAPPGSSRRRRARASSRFRRERRRRGWPSCAASARSSRAKLAPGGRRASRSRRRRRSSTPTGIVYSAAPAAPGRVAFLFPGQGSQYVGMGADLAMAIDAARAAWDRGRGARLRRAWRCTRWSSRRPSSPTRSATRRRRALTATEWAQPALGGAEPGAPARAVGARRAPGLRGRPQLRRGHRAARGGRARRGRRWSGWRGGAAS